MFRRRNTWKIVTLLVVLLMVAACGGNNNAPANNDDNNNAMTNEEMNEMEMTEEPTEEPTEEATEEAMDDDMDMAESPIFYADYWTWPFEADKLASMSNGRFYITVQDEGKIVSINPDADGYDVTFIDAAFEQPHHPWMAPGMRYVFINYQSEGKGDHDAMSVIDTFTNEIVDFQTGINDPFHGAFTPDGKYLISGDLAVETGNVHFIDMETNTLVASPETTGLRSRDIMITHDSKYAFIGHQGYDPDNGVLGSVDVMDIETQTIVATLGEGRCRSGRMSNDGSLVMYSCDRANNIIAISTDTLEIVGTIELPEGAGPFNISFRADDKYAYVGLKKMGHLGIIDVATLTLISTIESGTDTNSTYFHPTAPLAVVTNDGTDAHVTIINTETNELVSKIDVGGKGTHNGQWSPDGRWFLVSNRLGDTLSLLSYNADTGEIEWYDDIVVGFGTNGIIWTPTFCGVESLTHENIGDATNAPAVDAAGTCG